MKKRNLMDELTEGFTALAQQRSGKRTLRTHIVALKPAPRISARELAKLREKLNLSRGLFAGYLRTSRPKDVLEMSAKVQSITKQLGALDVANHAMTMRYIWACRNEGDALQRLGRLTEARASLEPCLNMTGEILKIRAGHRPALSARAFLPRSTL